MSFLPTQLAHESQLCKDSYPAGILRDEIDVVGHGPCAGQLGSCPFRLQQVSARMIMTNSFKRTHGILSCFTVSVLCLVAVCGTASSSSSSGLFADCARKSLMGDCEVNAQCCSGAVIRGRTCIICFLVKLSRADSGKLAFHPTFGELGNLVSRGSHSTDYQV